LGTAPISTARHGYTDRTEADDAKPVVGTVTVRIPLGIDGGTLQMVLRAGELLPSES
jgi:hypothetical protein